MAAIDTYLLKRTVMRNILWQRIGYKPHAEQLLVHRAIARGAKRIGCVWGRRSGKSIMAASELLTEATFPPSGSLPSRLVRITAPETDIVEPIFAYLWRWIVEMKVFGVSPTHKSQYQYYIDLPWGCRIEGKTTKEPASLLGDGISISASDEYAKDKPDIMPRYIIPTMLDTNGISMFLTTPDGIHNHAWRLYKEWRKQYELGDRKFYASNVSSYDNPALPAGELDELKAEYERSGSLDLFNQEYMAQAMSLSGAVYPMFSQERHVKDIPFIVGVPVTIALDWGYKNPFVCLFAQVLNGDEVIHIFDEIYQSGMTDLECCDSVKNRLGELPYDIGYADPSSPEAIKVFNDNAITIYKPSTKSATQINSISDGIIRVRKLLSTGRLVIHPKCVNLIREFESYVFNDRAEGEKPVKIDDHAVDACRYLVSGNALSCGEVNAIWV